MVGTKKSWSWFFALLGISFIGISCALAYVFVIVPSERQMGAVQRIFYFHLGSAIGSYVAIVAVFVGALGYLANRSSKMDALLEASGELGFVFCSMVLASGMIWGSVAWNTPFNLSDPRLVSFLLLWLIFLAFCLLRWFGEAEKIAAQSAVLGILGVVTVPIVIFSVKLLPATSQLHPQVIENRGLKHPDYYWALLIAVVSLVILLAVLLILRMRLGLLERRIRLEGVEK